MENSNLITENINEVVYEQYEPRFISADLVQLDRTVSNFSQEELSLS